MSSVPYATIGNDELEKAPSIGTDIMCPHCNQVHSIQYGDRVLKDGTTEPCKMLAFYKCPIKDKAYLCGINGKRVFG